MAYTDSHGNQWSADFGYSTPSTAFVASASIQGTNDGSLYLSERYNYPGDLQYSFSVPGGSYIVNLKFAENYCTAAACRTFDVLINGQRVLSRFDIFAQAGGASKALDEQFTVTTSSSITIQFLAVIGAPKVNAIEILPTAPGLNIISYHNGSFSQGQTGAAYILQVSNGTAAAPTLGTVTVTETTPAGLTLVSMSGQGWTCSANHCTRGDALQAGQSYPPINAVVNVAANAPSQVTNQASVSGGGSASPPAAADITTITPPAPALNISSSHSGSFAQGQTAAAYTVTVSNTGSTATSGVVTTADTIPVGLTLTSMAGTGWTCSSGSCARADALGAGSAYPSITVTVNVASNAPLQVTNQVMVSGGGTPTPVTYGDATIITDPPSSFAGPSAKEYIRLGARVIAIENIAPPSPPSVNLASPSNGPRANLRRHC